MLDTILGFKQKMGSLYIRDRRVVITWIKIDPCIVTQIKNREKDGYVAVQLGTGTKREKNFSKPLFGHLKKSSQIRGQGINNKKIAPRYLREVKVSETNGLKIGDEVGLDDVLKKGDIVTVVGVSKGKGFSGVVKRWGFAGGPKTHGQSDRERAPGSIGQRTTPGRVYKGKKMAGRMGGERVSVKNLTVIDIDEKKKWVAVTGAVPGVVGSLIYIKKVAEGGIKMESDKTFTEGSESVLEKEVVENQIGKTAKAEDSKEDRGDKKEVVKDGVAQEVHVDKENMKDK